MGAKNVCLMTDKNLSQLPPVRIVMDSLVANGINFKVYDNVRVEPTDRRYFIIIIIAYFKWKLTCIAVCLKLDPGRS